MAGRGAAGICGGQLDGLLSWTEVEILASLADGCMLRKMGWVERPSPQAG